MHRNLVRFSPIYIDQVPHHELLVATHGLAIELMISCALPLDFTGEPFMVKTEEDGKELRIFRGLIKLYILKAPLTQKLDDMLIALEASNEIATAVKLSAFSDTIHRFAIFENLDGKIRITVQGAKGLAMLQSSMGEFFRKNAPNFKLPMGLDTEVYFRPHKFEKHGFRQVAVI
jgi:hypothetical protein